MVVIALHTNSGDSCPSGMLSSIGTLRSVDLLGYGVFPVLRCRGAPAIDPFWLLGKGCRSMVGSGNRT